MTLSKEQNTVLLNAVQLVNEISDLDEALQSYSKIAKYVISTVPPDRQKDKPTTQEIYDLHDWLENEWRANNDGADLPIEVFAEAVLAMWGNCKQVNQKS